MSLPAAISDGDLGHNDDHEEIHSLLGRLDGQSDFLATALWRDTLANRPAAGAGNAGLFYNESDTDALNYSDGASWRQVVLSGVNITEDVLFGSGKPWVDVLADGTVAGDDTADDSVPLQAILAAHPTGLVYFPNATYKVAAGGLVVQIGQEVVFANIKLHSTYAGPALSLRSECAVRGRIEIDCDDVAGSVGLQWGDVGGVSCQRSYMEFVRVIDADTAIKFVSANSGGCFLNVLGYARVNSCVRGIEFSTSIGSAAWTNGNHVVHAVVTNCSSQGVYVNVADGTHFGYLELESNATTNGAYALDLVACLGFWVKGGWIEGNINTDTTRRSIRIANNPTVVGVEINASNDMDITSSTDFSHTFSTNRYVLIRNNQHSYEMGRMGAAALYVGPRALAADDLGELGRLQVSGGIECYRLSAAAPNFYMRAPTVGVGFVFSNGGGAVTPLHAEGDCTTVNNTNLLCLVNNGAQVARRIVMGAADSGGPGFRLLRVSN